MKNNTTYPTIPAARFHELTQEQDGHPMMVVFTVDWIGEATIMDMAIERMAEKYFGVMKFYRLDADRSPGLVSRLGIQELPTLLFFKKGEMVDQLAGVTSKKNIEIRVNSLL